MPRIVIHPVAFGMDAHPERQGLSPPDIELGNGFLRVQNGRCRFIEPSSSWLQRARHSWSVFRHARRDGSGKYHEAKSAAVVARPKVSVMVITYNHERFIAQALDSILTQESGFSVEINVIDDASTDGTQEIVRRYAERYPGTVRCFFNARNMGHVATQLNTYRGFQTLRGDYFALLEGDDYWTDPHKLGKQIAFLECNPGFVACGSSTLKVYDDGSRSPEHFLPFKAFGRRTANMLDLVGLAGVFHLSGTLYRNVFGQCPPMCLADEYSCETTINMVYGQFGDFFHIDEYMSAYRVHGSGVFSPRSQEDIWLYHLHGFRRFSLYLGPRYAYEFSRAIMGFSWYVLNAHRKGLGPLLKGSTKLLFFTHFLVAYPIYRILSISRKIYSVLWLTVQCLKVDPTLLSAKFSRIDSLYDVAVEFTPRWLADKIVLLEEQFLALGRWRHQWKRASKRRANKEKQEP